VEHDDPGASPVQGGDQLGVLDEPPAVSGRNLGGALVDGDQQQAVVDPAAREPAVAHLPLEPLAETARDSRPSGQGQ
jgi:hypothetical protein